MQNILKRIKELRQENFKENQTQFAKRIGLKQSSYSMIECGKRAFPDFYIKALCSSCNVNEKWLRYGEGEKFHTSPLYPEFIDIYTSLCQSNQKFLLEIARHMYKMQNADIE